MNLPDITGIIPNIVLPFDIPEMFHPLMGHLLIAVPVIVLLIELVNLVMNKKAVSGLSFFLILLMGAMATATCIMGQENTEASKHLLETYLMVGAVAVLIFKLLSMLSQKTLVKLFYILVLAFFVFLILQYDKMNVNASNIVASPIEVSDEKTEEVTITVVPAKEVKPMVAVESVSTVVAVPQVEVAEVIETTPVVENVKAEEEPQSVMESTGIESATTQNIVEPNIIEPAIEKFVEVATVPSVQAQTEEVQVITE